MGRAGSRIRTPASTRVDDFALSGLSPEAKQPYYGPYPILNTALNLNAGSELATQERKAASFVLTPAYSGFDPPTSRENERESEKMAAAYAAKTTDSARSMAENWSPVYDEFEVHGYRPTQGYAYPEGPDIGTAVAISGAAANPNWGYHTSGPMAFLLTVFNARLGWWLGNPRWRLSCREPGPKFALKYLFAELLGRTNGRSQFVNLSDGGHFDNIGLYELVRRRCRFIIVCDSEEDQQLTFGSLGAAIRKCRADFGVEIDINPDPIRRDADRFSHAHCVVGRIIYPEAERAFNAGLTTGMPDLPDPDGSDAVKSFGWLVYLKSSLTGDEPADVIEYQSQHGEFPHQSTADQFFSESQFESYRRLGYHVLRSAFDEVELPDDAFTAVELARTDSEPNSTPRLADRPLVPLFQALTSKWYAPIGVPGRSRVTPGGQLCQSPAAVGGDRATEGAASGAGARALGRSSGDRPAEPHADRRRHRAVATHGERVRRVRLRARLQPQQSAKCRVGARLREVAQESPAVRTDLADRQRRLQPAVPALHRSARETAARRVAALMRGRGGRGVG